MFPYAITINKGHLYYNDDIDVVVDFFIRHFGGKLEYLEIVSHKDDHYHLLICVYDYTLSDMKTGEFYVESCNNVVAYRKYMHSHDVTREKTFGNLPYFDNEPSIGELLEIGKIAFVQKYGWKALKSYNAISKFYDDWKGGK